MKQLTESDIKALIRLLADSDQHTSGLARDRLVTEGDRAIPYLYAATDNPDSIIRGRSRLLLEDLRFQTLADAVETFAARPDFLLDLEEGALLIARYRYPDLDMAAYSRTLDEMATEIRQALHQDMGMAEIIGIMNAFVFDAWGFRGNREKYYDPDNSCMNRVIDRRLGIPITLSVLYILLGRRLGLPLRGVGMPGHFVVHYAGPEGTVWIDPFHGGQVLSREDCERRLEEMGESVHEAQLEPTPVRQLLVRMLVNLVRIYTQTEQNVQAEQVEGLIKIILRRDEDEEMADPGQSGL